MHRRDFLKAMPLATAPALLASSPSRKASVNSETRLGDLLLRWVANDHLELRFTPDRPRELRLLQLTDTHFHPGDSTNKATETLLRNVVAQAKPDFVIHTGDFVNNDSKSLVDWTGMSIMNGLKVPWTLCFGNHDYPVHNAEGSLPLEQIRQKMENGFQGFVDSPTGRHYCYRYDLFQGDSTLPSACLFYFQVGYATGDRRISDAQLAWFSAQMEQDNARNVNCPITAFVHIPLIEYRSLFESGKASGQKGEEICFDSDTGDSFKRFTASRRVQAVFCGHDHVNNYHGQWDGVELAYGRVSGWGGYGPPEWKRGGRLITLNLDIQNPPTRHLEVF